MVSTIVKAKTGETCEPCEHIYEEVYEDVRPPRCGPYTQRAMVCPVCFNHKVTEEQRKHNHGQFHAMYGKR